MVKQLTPKTVIKIWDMDSCATVAEVEEAFKRSLPDYAGHIGVTMSRANFREQRLAIVTMEEEAARTLLDTSRIRIGLVNGKIRREKVVARCYRYLGYGHESRDCKGADCSQMCYKCGIKDHKAATCQSAPVCFLCKERNKEARHDHVAGAAVCPVWKEALARSKREWL